MSPREIKVFIIDDSPVILSLLKYMIGSEPGMSVVGTASNGQEALRYLEKNRPDVITTDMNMPKMDGLETVRQIMRHYAIPILVVSGSCHPFSEEKVFQALEAGALALLAKPAGVQDPNFAAIRQELIDMLKVMSEVKVVRRTYHPRPSLSPAALSLKEQKTEGTADADFQTCYPIKAVAIGASTGGPQALHSLFSELPQNFPVPIFVVQHISPGFIDALAVWLNQVSPLKVQIAAHQQLAEPGNIYLAPDGFHMEIQDNHKIALSCSEIKRGMACPSVSRLFRSVADVYGRHSIGILLTGMGKDGAEELLLMKQKGAYTIAQDEESSVIFGMPREAILLGGATKVLALNQMAHALKRLLKIK